MLKAKDAPNLSSFNWEDPLLLDAQLEDDERMIRDSARAYAQEKLQPRVIEAYREEKAEPGIFAEMGEMGLLGSTIPEEYGGIGAGYVAYGLVAREIEQSLVDALEQKTIDLDALEDALHHVSQR